MGVLIGNKLRESTRSLMMDVLGAVTLISAAASVFAMWDESLVMSTPKGAPLLIVLAALLVGGGVGAFFNIESRLENLGVYLKEKLDKDGKSPFVEGFVTASLIFVIGPLAILGSISDGMAYRHRTIDIEKYLGLFCSNGLRRCFGLGSGSFSLAGRYLPILLDWRGSVGWAGSNGLSDQRHDSGWWCVTFWYRLEAVKD